MYRIKYRKDNSTASESKLSNNRFDVKLSGYMSCSFVNRFYTALFLRRSVRHINKQALFVNNLCEHLAGSNLLCEFSNLSIDVKRFYKVSMLMLA